jgi:hypothetical protein
VGPFDFDNNWYRINDVDVIHSGGASPASAIGSNNKLYIAWEDRRNATAGNRPHLFFANVTTTTGPFVISNDVVVNDSSPVTTEHLSPDIAVDSLGDLYIVWSNNRNGTQDIYCAKSTDEGQTFGSDKIVNTVNVSQQLKPTIDINDVDNHIFIAWEDWQNNNSDIFVANSTDFGITFSAGKRVDSDNSDSDQSGPVIAATVKDFNPAVLVAWSDQRNIIYKQDEQYFRNYDIYFTRSEDDGSNYVKDYIIHTYQGQPAVTVDDEGIVYAVWSDYRFGEWGGIFFAKSHTGGQSFSVNTQISDNITDRGRANPDITVKDNVIYVVWEDSRFSNINKTIMFSKSTDGGETFSAGVEVIVEIDNQQDPALVVDKTGKIHVVWEDAFNVGPQRTYDVRYSNSTDNGTTWSQPIRVNGRFTSNSSWNPSIAVNDSASTPEIYVVYQNISLSDDIDIYFSRSTDGGFTFQENSIGINDDFGSEPQTNPAIAVDSNGYIAVVWEDFRSGFEGDIYMSISTNNGGLFGTNRIVNASAGNDRYPDIAIDPNNVNNLTVVFQSDMNTAPNTSYNIYQISSTDGGLTFASPVRIDDSGSNIRDQIYPKIAMDSSGSIHTIWEDLRDGIGDIYYNFTLDRTMPIAEAGADYQLSQADIGQMYAAGSWDNFGIKNYTWTFIDSIPITLYEYNARYEFNNPGVFIITLTVIDYNGNMDTDTFVVTVIDNTPPNFITDSSDTVAYTGNQFTFKVTVTDFALNLINVEYWYSLTNATTWNVTMIPTGTPNQYKLDITVLDTLEPIYYHFWANDTRKNWNKLLGKTYPVPVLDDDLPELTDNTPSTGNTGNSLTFSIGVSDNIKVDRGFVKYKYGSSGPYSSAMALTKSGPTYTKTITINNTLDTLYYYFIFNDTSNNINISSENSITISDDDLPEFVEDNSDTQAFAGKTFKFSLKFTDNIEAFSAHVQFKFGSTGQFTTRTLTKNGDYWEFSIMIPQALDSLFYTFYFNDTTPANINNTNEIEIVVVDDTSPSSISGSGDIPATTGESFTVFAKFTDNIGLDSVKIYYRKVSTTTWMDTTVTVGTDDTYTVTNGDLSIVTTTDDPDWKYYFVAEDAATLSANYGTASVPYTVTVTDNDKPEAAAGADISGTLKDEKLSVQFDASNSTDNIDITVYKWSFYYQNRERDLTTANPKFVFQESGAYDVTLNVSDAAGNSDEDTLKITIISDFTPPTVTLDYPDDDDIILETTVTLRWSTDHPDAAQVVYDVSWGTSPNPSIMETDLAATQLELTGLVDGMTYYWKVLPKLAGKDGQISPIQKFKVDLGFEQIYEVDITADKTSVIIQQGNSEDITLTIENTGNGDDVFNIQVDKKNFPETATLSNDQVVLDNGDSLTITLTITTKELTLKGDYKITVKVISDGAQMAGQSVSDSVTIDVKVVEKPKGEDTDGDGLPDTWEVQYFTDITKYGADDDPDNDGLTNLQEYYGETNPMVSDLDSDKDGLPDAWELLHFQSITKYTGSDDPDKDGKTNLQEFLGPDGVAGGDDSTDPNKSDKPDKNGDGTDNTMAIAGAGIVVVIIIVILLLLMMMKKKKASASEAEKPDELETGGPDRVTKGPPSTPSRPTTPTPTTPVPQKPPIKPTPGGPSPGTPGGPGAVTPTPQPQPQKPPVSPDQFGKPGL